MPNRELTIDFVLHEDYGPASNWAASASAGETLGIGMKKDSRSVVPESDNYLLVGDHSALPVISNILEQLPECAKAKVLLEVNNKSDELTLTSKAPIEARWLHNSKPKRGSQLAKVTKLMLKDTEEGKTFVFVAAEYKTVTKLKHYLKNGLMWNDENYFAVSYWKADKIEVS